ncbi:unnamed protein product [Cercospora beticola]|nr:unnamed protein product [Cercospora beticola]
MLLARMCFLSPAVAVLAVVQRSLQPPSPNLATLHPVTREPWMRETRLSQEAAVLKRHLYRHFHGRPPRLQALPSHVLLWIAVLISICESARHVFQTKLSPDRSLPIK